MICVWCKQEIEKGQRYSVITPVAIGENGEISLKETPQAFHRSCLRQYETSVLWGCKEKKLCSNQQNGE